jgi:serine protease Do
MSRTILKRSAIALALGVALGTGYELGANGVHSITAARAVVAEATPAPVAPVSAASAAAQVTLPAFDSIVTRYGPAVVNISVEGTTKTAMRGGTPFGNLDPNDPFYDFFRRFGPQFQMPRGGEQIVRGMGSGFIITLNDFRRSQQNGQRRHLRLTQRHLHD